MTKVTVNAKEIASNEDYILQVEKRIEEKENTLKEYAETFNEKMAAGKTVKSLTLTAEKIARTLNDIEEMKNQIAGYQARIDSLQAEIDAASVEKNAVEVGDDDKAIEIQQINAYIRSERNQIENCNIAIDSFKNELEYLEKSFNKYLEKNDAAGMVDAAKTIKSKLQHIAKVEGKIANCEKRIETLKAELAQYTEKTAIEENAVEDSDVTVVKVNESEIKAAVAELETIGKHFNDIMDVAVDEELPNWEREQEKLIRKHFAAECKEKAKFLRNFFVKIGIPKKFLKISVKREGDLADYIITIEPKTEKINFEKLEELASYFENGNVGFVGNTEVWVEEFIDGVDGKYDVLGDNDFIEIEILTEPDNDDSPEPDNRKNAVEEEIENLLDEVDNGKFAVEVAESRIEEVQAEFNEVKDTAEQAKAKEIQFLIDCANDEIDFAKKRIADAMKEIDRKNINNAKAEIAGMVERIEYAGETLDRAISVLADVEESAAVKFEVGKVYFTKNYADCYGSTMLFKVVNRDNQKVTLQYFETPPRHCVGEHKPEKYTIYPTKGNVECVYISEGYTLCAKDLHSGKYAGVNATDDKYETLEIVDGVIQESVEVEELPTIDKLKAKAAEQKKPHKSIIDWTATLKDYTKQDIRILQNDLRRFIEIGEIELAAKMFETIKEKYRALYAA